jgi:hypothetical protein
VTQLIDLKDRSISQTADIAASIESLELMADVRDQMQQMAQTFGRMRNWVVEIVAFEPVITRAMRSLQPLVQMGNLRHMNPAELRQVIRTMNEQNELQYSGQSDDGPTASANAPSAAPPINEAALAK